MPWLGVLVLAVWTAACGRQAGGAPEHASRETHVGPLLQLVPPGPSYVLTARPKELAQHASARDLWRAVVSEQRELAFVQRTGIAPQEVEELVAVEAGEGGYVLLARGPFDADEVVHHFGERIALPDVSVDEPILRREGLRGDGRYAYAALDSHAVLAAKDAPPEFIAAFLARRGDPKRPRAFDDADAHALELDHAAAPLVLYGLQPLSFEGGASVALLFARQRTLAFAVKPGASSLQVALDFRGEFPPGADANFRTLARSIGQAPLGAALGLARIAEEMSVRVDKQGVLLTTQIAAADLMASVRMMLVEEVRELFD